MTLVCFATGLSWTGVYVGELGSGLDLSIVGGSVGHPDLNLYRIEDRDGNQRVRVEDMVAREKERESTLFPSTAPAPYSSFSRVICIAKPAGGGTAAGQLGLILLTG